MLYDRIVNEGTLADPGGVPTPRFSLPSTVNWMRSLAFVLDDTGLTFPSARASYRTIRPYGAITRPAANTVYEQMFLALHQLAALEFLSTAPRQSDVGRIGIVTWYYGIYAAARAMLIAQTGTALDTHAGVANGWDSQLAAVGRVLPPFNLRVSTLVERDSDAELAVLARGLRGDLQRSPTSTDEAHAACCSYLSGTCDWYRWNICESLKGETEFRRLGFTDFRKKDARELRDRRFSGKSVGFLHQAFRYRGKANYREAIFLAYGGTTEASLAGYQNDLTRVLRGFLVMAAAFVERRLGAADWRAFVDDVEANRAFSLSPRTVWA